MLRVKAIVTLEVMSHCAQSEVTVSALDHCDTGGCIPFLSELHRTYSFPRKCYEDKG